jgi:cell cycle checkpoint protein
MSELGHPTVFSAVSTAARNIYQILNCISFAAKVQVTIREDGLQFSANEAQILQATAFLDRKLFTSYRFNPLLDLNEEPELPGFQISLRALLETLQIFGAADASMKFGRKEDDEYGTSIRPERVAAFSNKVLGMTGVCRFIYEGEGEPFKIILEESGVTTTCELNTYLPGTMVDIPFDKQELQAKIIVQPRFIYDAITEVSSSTATASTSSSRVGVLISSHSPYLSFSTVGPFGSATVDFSNGKELFETFTVSSRWAQSYRFDFIRYAVEALKLASKVSIRGDSQGVLSLQFMVEVDGNNHFVDFLFAPLIASDEDIEGDEDESGDDYEDDDLEEGTP